MVVKKVTRTVEKVIDGDTFKVKVKVNGNNYIRLGNIDIPEKKNLEIYKKAKAALKRKIEGKVVTITTSVKGHYGRPLAKVTYNRENINKFMKKYEVVNRK